MKTAGLIQTAMLISTIWLFATGHWIAGIVSTLFTVFSLYARD